MRVIEAKRDAIGVDKALLPIGSIEQHGKHLPLATDGIIAERIAELISHQIDAIVLPCIYYGLSQEHKPYFNISIKNDTLSSLIYDIYSSLKEQGIRLFIINGHFGNSSLLESLPKMGYDLYILSYWQVLDERLGHADRIETSLMLAIAPELVDMSKAEAGRLKSIDDSILSTILQHEGSIKDVSENGVIGDPTMASSEEGRILLDIISSKLASIIRSIDTL